MGIVLYFMVVRKVPFAIVEAMESIGFPAKDIKDSLCQRKFNQTIGVLAAIPEDLIILELNL